MDMFRSTATTALSSAFILSFAVLLHLGCLDNAFVYDDAFAIVQNRDVLGKTSWYSLLEHDFWGQSMTSSSSHKSFRPLTVACWRLLHSWTAGPSRAFHMLNLLMHGTVSAQVFVFARGIFSCFDQPYVNWRGLVAGLFFASHPVHTEAVLGAVGFAELLCASLALMALQVLLIGKGSIFAFRHYAIGGIVNASIGALLILAAAFAKEIGITTFGVVALWDIIVVPVLYASRSAKTPARPPNDDDSANVDDLWLEKIKRAEVHTTSAKKDGILLVPRNEQAPAPNDNSKRTGMGCLWLRSIISCRVLACSLFVYLYRDLRRRIAGGQDLVSNYRRVENPLPFAETWRTRILSIAFNHATYAQLLAFPKKLSCDWSYACIPYVTDWVDVRNLLSLALYSCLALCLTRCQPGHVVHRLCAWLDLPTKSQVDGVRQVFLVYGLIVIPFVPAANIFFWVGTAVAERLLYLPSVGFVILVADLLVPVRQSRIVYRLCRVLLIASALAVCCRRSFQRVPDWKSDEKLFEAACKVCPTSAKVLQNLGIMEQNKKNYKKALKHFVAARRAEPTLCDVGYFIGQTRFMQGNISGGLPLIREAARTCPTSRLKSVALLSGLVQGFDVKIASAETVGVLRDMAIAHFSHEHRAPAQGCFLAERAVWARLLSPHSNGGATSVKDLRNEVQEIYAECERSLNATCNSRFPAASPWSAACIRARSSVARQYASFGHSSKAGSRTKLEQAIHKYLRTAQQLGCWRSFADSPEEDFCGVKPSTLPRFPWEQRRTNRAANAAAQGAVSEGHRFAVHATQTMDSYDPWLHKAWGDIVALEGRSAEGARHLEAAAGLLLHALSSTKGSASDVGMDVSRYLESRLAPQREKIPDLARELRQQSAWLTQRSGTSG